jgi:Domain of unknown function (DUF4835)
MFKQILACFIVSLLVCHQAFAQAGELNASVRVSTPQLQRNDRKVFDQMEIAVKEFLNNTKWTKDAFEQDERIECSFIITISEELDNNSFKAELAVQSVRPTFGSSYKTPMLSHLDKDFVFFYDQNTPIEFLPDANDNQNLSAVLAFYAYLMIGLDYDSFSLYGGEQQFLTLQQMVTNIQNSNNPGFGWRPADGGKNRNRHWIVENFTNPRCKPYRGAMYSYYRKGLDLFMSNIDQGKAGVLQALEDVDKVNVAYFNSMLVQMFSNAKREELVEMWKLGPKAQRERVAQIMSKIDPANASRYRDITY